MADRQATLVLTLRDLASKALEKAKGVMASYASVVAGLSSAYATLKIFVIDALQAFAEQEKAVAKLNIALKNQGVYTDTASQQMQEFAAQLQRTTTYSDDTILEIQALITTFGLVGERANEATKAATDLAAGLGIDLRSAALLVGKAFAGETSTLSRYGIKISDTIPAAEKFSAVLAAINSRFGGAATADAKTFTGQMAQLKNEFNDLQEDIGAFLVGPALKLVAFFKDLVAVARPTAAAVNTQRPGSLTPIARS